MKIKYVQQYMMIVGNNMQWVVYKNCLMTFLNK